MRDMLRKRSKISEEPEDPIDDPFPPLDGNSEYFAEYDFDILDQVFKLVSIDHATKERLCAPLIAPQCRMRVPMEEVGRGDGQAFNGAAIRKGYGSNSQAFAEAINSESPSC